ncbi:MAG: 3-ketoacyl-ACP reductase [Paenibacillus sp. RIFOXYA1_FULL_44_5]|nr:MAG: 3-ketoacyl-ACP reductase [Paenibacillus sp. RIFOXYA1_FULL_44_5]
MKLFHDMNVLVTGASRGIGAAIAEKFASAGINVIIHYGSSHEAANEVARKCMAYHVKVLTVCADLQDMDQILRMQEKLVQHEMIPDIIVNNAAVSHYGMIQDVTEQQWDYVMNVNLKAMFFCTQAFLPDLIKQKYGRIINLSSVWGTSGAACEAIYSASKGAVDALTKSLAKELAPSGITVNAVSPGVVDTEMNTHLNEDERECLKQEIPAGRFAAPEEIASLVYFLALPESSYITGQIISPNGGWIT